jgi:Protein of unknown function (DUF3341)
MAHAAPTSTRYGLLAEFDSADALLGAAKRVTSAGYTKTDAFSPMPIHGLAEAIGFHENLVPKVILGGGIAGLAAGFGLQYWTQVIAYPMNIGGRPTFSWVSWIPPMFEMTILFAASAAVFGMLALNGLPQPYHPVFNAKRFSLASQDKFFLVIEAADPKFNLDQTRAFLSSLQAREVVDVEE